MILKILGSIIFFTTFIFANVVLEAPNEFVKGDSVVFSIKASGSNIEFPTIDNIDGFDVQKNGSTNNITIINGKRSENRVQSYIFFPNKTVTIPSLKVKIDGKNELTKPHQIKLSKVQKTTSKLFDLKLKVNKNKVYVAEDIKLTLIFKYSTKANIIDIGFTDPVFENFWSKQYGKPVKYSQNGFVVQELTYLLFPQKEGLLKIDPVKIDIVLQDPRDPFSFLGQGKNKRIYSNSIDIDVKPLPNNVKLIGDFKIKTKVNKTTIDSGEAVSYSINIEGRGNIDDLDEIKLDIPDVTIYENKAKKTYDVNSSGKYGGTYTKSFSIVAQNNFTIPAISIKFFDKKTKKIKTINSKLYNIKVKNKTANNIKNDTKPTLQKMVQEPVVKQKVIVKTVDTTIKEKIMYLIFGMIIMLFLVILYNYLVSKKSKKEQLELPLTKKVKKAKTKDQLLKLLVVYIGLNEELDSIIYSLEKDDNIEIKSIKKQILLILKQMKL